MRIRVVTVFIASVVSSLSTVLFTGCPDVPRAADPVSSVAELEADVCALTTTFSGLLNGNTALGPTDVIVAHAAAWDDLGYAYDIAKLEIERCIDPALEATFSTGVEVWPSRPPVLATKKFDPSRLSSFTDNPNAGASVQGGRSSIVLDTVNAAHGAELHLKVQ